MRRTIAASVVMAAGLVAPLTVHHWSSRAHHSVTTVLTAPADLGTLTAADVALVKGRFPIAGQPAGTQLTAIKAPGARVWATFNADVSVGPDTAIAKRHDLIVALIAYPTPVQDWSGDLLLGATPGKISGRSYIIDATDGRVFEESGVPVRATPDGHTPLPSVLGTPTDLTAI